MPRNQNMSKRDWSFDDRRHTILNFRLSDNLLDRFAEGKIRWSSRFYRNHNRIHDRLYARYRKLNKFLR